MKLVQIILKLALKKLFSVMKTRAHRTDGSADDFGDFLVAEAVDFKKRYHRAVFDRQFLEGIVQFFLELGH